MPTNGRRYRPFLISAAKPLTSNFAPPYEAVNSQDIYSSNKKLSMVRKFDFLVIGSGVAGMSFALQVAAAKKGKVALVCKSTIDEANTAKAQGGVASVTNMEVDNFEKHIHDTMVAGDFISDPEAVRQVVEQAPAGIERLVKIAAREEVRA